MDDTKDTVVGLDGEGMDVKAKELQRRALWKVDLLIMPILTISFGLQYYDKAVIGSASVFGLIKDLQLSTTSPTGVVSTLRYSSANAAFYWGYIVAVLPFAIILQRLPLARTLGCCILVWGIAAILTVVCTDYKGLIAQRVFLGLVESAVSPGFIAITALWYTNEEQATRIGLWYSATGIFSMFSGAINYGLGSIGPSHGLSPWKYMYFFAGSITILWSSVFFFLLPDRPGDRSWMSQKLWSEEEREWLLERTRAGRKAREGEKFEWVQVREALMDVKVLSFLVMGAAIYIANGSVTAFGARIVSSFGYTSLQTIAIIIPGGAFTCAAIYLFSWLAGRYKNSITILIPLSTLPVIVGSLIIWKGSWVHRGLPLFGYYLLPTFGAPYVLLLALASANVRGSTKRAVSSGLIFVGYNVGNIAAPYLVLTPEKPIKYRTTWISTIVAMVVTILLSLFLRFYMARQNAFRDRLSAARGDESVREKDEVRDEDEVWTREETDVKDLGFRYSL